MLRAIYVDASADPSTWKQEMCVKQMRYSALNLGVTSQDMIRIPN